MNRMPSSFPSYPSIFSLVGIFPSGFVASHYFHCCIICQLLCFRQLALRIVVEDFHRPFSRLLLLQGYKLQTRYA
jgi:hypothetical protein